MRFQHVKAEELEGPIKLAGFSEWRDTGHELTGVTSILMAAAPGTGKGAAVGVLGDRLKYDIVRCRLKQLLEYPDPAGEFKAMLEGTEHLHRTLLWLDGMDGFLEKLPGGSAAGARILEGWLKTEREPLKKNEVLVVATAREMQNVPAPVADAFDRTFAQ